MSMANRLGREWKFLAGLMRTLNRVSSISATSANLICDDIEAAVDRWRERPAMRFEGRVITYGDLDAMANRFAHWAQERSIVRGETVAIFLPNRLEYLPIWYGLSKVGVASALINNQLTGAALTHCLDISGARNVIVDDETWPALKVVRAQAARGQLTHDQQPWTLGETHQGEHDLGLALKSCSPLRPDRGVRDGLTGRDTALFIYTSGTTGLPKAARITHMRAQLYMRGFAGATDAKADDVIYVPLPLYHATGGLCGTGAALLNGGEVVLKRRFSASQFWPDIKAEGCTQFVYIGELCRYLANQAAVPEEQGHKLRAAFGNGLRPDVWAVMEERFGVPHILEFYGSTEGNVSMFNFDGHRGAIGRAPDYLKFLFNIRLVKFDVETETPVRGPDGCCLEADVDEAGECLGEIKDDARTSYTGYADKAASEKKILHDVFDKGDRWFRTGDLMKRDQEGYFYFVDRIGDTFRWKGENVSTGEVSGRLLAFPGVKEANVYGVTVGAMDGRAGMAGLVVGEGFDIKAFGEFVAVELPAYAQPVFVRLLPEIETTGTFKYRKMDLVAEGFDPAVIKTPLYVRDGAKGYAKLTKPMREKILAGEMRL